MNFDGLLRINGLSTYILHSLLLSFSLLSSSLRADGGVLDCHRSVTRSRAYYLYYLAIAHFLPSAVSSLPRR